MKLKLQPIKNVYHLLNAYLANWWYGYPGRKLKVVGITGTDGKTTTSSLVYHILKTCGKRASLITTVNAVIAGKTFDTGFHVTTPSSFAVQKLLSQSVAANDEFFILETTSHALDQNRVWGVPFTIGLITNITHEHLDYHKTLDKYARAKVKLLTQAKVALINRDDASYNLLKTLKSLGNHAQLKTYSTDSPADYTFNKTWIEAIYGYNRENYAAAYAICSELGLQEAQILHAMESYHLPPGRVEVVYDRDFKVIVDFAHTPNSLSKLLATLKKDTKGRLIHVFGAAGLRDSSKRKAMGEASSTNADYIILTEEDYRTEDPQKICAEIAAGFKPGAEYEVIIDRKQAIARAVEIAKPGDLVVTTGKGHEQSLCRGKTEYPWSEKGAILAALKV